MRNKIRFFLCTLMVAVLLVSTLGLITIQAQSVKFTFSNITMYIGQTTKASLVTSPENLPASSFFFTTSNKRVAGVDKNGKIKAYNKGTTVITVSIPGNKKVSAKCVVTVTDRKVTSLVIAYLPNDAKDELTIFREGLSRDMQKALATLGINKVREFVANDYNAAIEAMRTGKADIVSFGPLSYLQARERANAECIVAPAIDGKKENCGYYSYIITQANNTKINSITDLKNTKFAFVDPNSTSGNLVPSYEIIKAFPKENLTIEDLHTNGKFFSAVTFSGSHPNGLQAVAKGDIDAAPCASDTYDRETANKNIDTKSVKIIYKSFQIMASPIAVRGDLTTDLKGAIRDFYVKYDNNDYFVKFIGQKPGQRIRYIPVDYSDYKSIDELRKMFGL